MFTEWHARDRVQVERITSANACNYIRGMRNNNVMFHGAITPHNMRWSLYLVYFTLSNAVTTFLHRITVLDKYMKYNYVLFKRIGCFFMMG